jgi:hypothetical protein
MSAVERGRVFDHRVTVERGYDLFQQFPAAFGVRYFPASKNDGYLDAIVLLEEFFNVAYLEINIVSFDFGAYFYFFDEAADLAFAGVALPLPLLVQVFTEIHYPANGRFGVRRDLDQVEAFLFSLGQRFAGGDYAYLPSLLVNKANLRNAYPPVHPGPLFYDIELPPS